jgi:N,N'-diacetylchitobiose transport system permease protein
MVDGATRFGAFMRILLPLVGPGLVATSIFAFIQAWNEFTFALVIMNRPDTRTLPVWLNAFVQATQATDWAAIMAGSTLMAVPVIIFFLLVQGRMAAGVASGAVKG